MQDTQDSPVDLGQNNRGSSPNNGGGSDPENNGQGSPRNNGQGSPRNNGQGSPRNSRLGSPSNGGQGSSRNSRLGDLRNGGLDDPRNNRLGEPGDIETHNSLVNDPRYNFRTSLTIQKLLGQIRTQTHVRLTGKPHIYSTVHFVNRSTLTRAEVDTLHSALKNRANLQERGDSNPLYISRRNVYSSASTRI
jgi:hypothetical protein